MKRYILPIYVNRKPNNRIKSTIFIKRMTKDTYRLTYSLGSYFNFWEILLDDTAGFTKRQGQWLFKDLKKHPDKLRAIKDQYRVIIAIKAIKYVDYKLAKHLYDILFSSKSITPVKKMLGQWAHKFVTRPIDLESVVDSLKVSTKLNSDRDMRHDFIDLQPVIESIPVKNINANDLKPRVIKALKVAKSQGLLK